MQKASIIGYAFISVWTLNAVAGYEIEFTNNGFYTDDASLFTVSRQLSLLDDPTQPTVDIPARLADFVYEPLAKASWREESSTPLAVSLEAGGYVFADNPDFTHARMEFSVSQAFKTNTHVELIYKFIPDRLLGNNLLRSETNLSGGDFGDETESTLTPEQVTSHSWSTHLMQHIREDFSLHLLARYGLREYNQSFNHRDTHLWTLGTHAAWDISKATRLFFGYHYEAGLVDSVRSAEQFNDDVSYVSHYASVELIQELADDFEVNLIFDFEHNDFTTNNLHDEHYQNPEAIFQGEIELKYVANASTEIALGYQHGRRKKDKEAVSFSNNNLWLGVTYTF